MDITYINGSDIMLYLDGKPSLAAKSHKISYKTNTKQIITKDVQNSLYAQKIVTRIDVSISCDALVAVGDSKSFGSTELLAKLKEAKTVDLRYGNKDNTGTFEEGKFIIDSIDITSPAGEEASYTATFSNYGEVKTVPASSVASHS